MTQEEIEDFAYSVRRKYQNEQAELKGGMCEHIMFDAMEIQKGVLLGVEFAQSKMYSEEEVLVLLELAVKRGLYLESGVIPYQANVTKEWFETIKKK